MSGVFGGFPSLGVPFQEASETRIIAFGVYIGVPVYGDYHVGGYTGHAGLMCV